MVAISYYLLSLMGYLVKGAHALGFVRFDYNLVLMAMFVPVIGLVWWATHRARKAILKKPSGDD